MFLTNRNLVKHNDVANVCGRHNVLQAEWKYGLHRIMFILFETYLAPWSKILIIYLRQT